MKIRKSHPDNIMAKCFDKKYFEKLNNTDKERLLKCCNSGIENPDSQMGCYAVSPTDYDDLKPFFKAALEAYHKVDLSKTSHKNNWDFSTAEGLPEGGQLDLTKLGLPALSMRVRTGRNLNKYKLPGSMTKEDRINIEKEMKTVFDALIADPSYGGKYVSITPGHENFINETE